MIINENNAALCNSLRSGALNDPFTINSSFRVNTSEIRTVKFNNDGKEETISVTQHGDDFKVKVNEGEWRNVCVKTMKDEGRFSLKVSIDGSVFNYSVVITPKTVTIFNEVTVDMISNVIYLFSLILQKGKTELQITQAKFLASSDDADASKSSLSAPMPGIIDKVTV